MTSTASRLAGALAVAYAHGPLAGVAPGIAAERDGPGFRVRAIWRVCDGSVALEARDTTLDACHERITRQLLRLWPDLEQTGEWL